MIERMEQAPAFDAPNPNLLDKNTRQMLKWWWVYGLLAVMFLGAAILITAITLPLYLSMASDHDAFVAQSVRGYGTVTRCSRYIGTWVSYDFAPVGYQIIQGSAGYYDGRGCSQHPSGSSIAIRYLPSNPYRSEALDESLLFRHAFTMMLFQVTTLILSGLIQAWICVRAWRLRYRGQLRQGRLLSVTRIFGDGLIWVRYQVPTNDGKWVSGFQGMRGRTIDPAAGKGSPIAVLYAGKHIHMPVRSII